MNMDCPVCYECLDLDNTVVFADCNHCFCVFCSQEILFQKKTKCPLDKFQVKTISSMGQSKSLLEYQLEIWNAKKENIYREIEEYTCAFFSNVIDNLTLAHEIVLNTSGIFGDWLREYSPVDPCEIEDLNHSLIDCFRRHMKIWLRMSNEIRNARNIIENLFYIDKIQTNRNILYLTEMNLDQIYALVLQLKLKCYLHLNDDFLDQRKSIEDNKKMLDGITNIISTVRTFTVGLIISCVSTNGDLYRAIRPNINITDVDLCLMCSKEINGSMCGTFTKCDHKICISCINTFIITTGSCPFHNRAFSNLIFSYGNDTKNEFILFNFENRIEELIEEEMDLDREMVDVIRQINTNFPDFIKQLVLVYSTIVVETQSSSEEILALINNMNTSLLNVPFEGVLSDNSSTCINSLLLACINKRLSLIEYKPVTNGLLDLIRINNSKLLRLIDSFKHLRNIFVFYMDSTQLEHLQEAAKEFFTDYVDVYEYISGHRNTTQYEPFDELLSLLKSYLDVDYKTKLYIMTLIHG